MVSPLNNLLEAVMHEVRQGASDLHLMPGRSPVVKADRRTSMLDARLLEAGETVQFMKSLTPERNQKELEEIGSTNFGFAFSHDDRFEVTAFSVLDGIAIGLHRIKTN